MEEREREHERQADKEAKASKGGKPVMLKFPLGSEAKTRRIKEESMTPEEFENTRKTAEEKLARERLAMNKQGRMRTKQEESEAMAKEMGTLKRVVEVENMKDKGVLGETFNAEDETLNEEDERMIEKRLRMNERE